MHGNFLAAMKAQELKASSIQLWAPACTVEFATAKYGAAFASKVADPQTTYVEVLSDDNEKSDPCIPVLYSKSLLYLVSRALEPEHKTPVLGLQRAWSTRPEDDDTFMKGHQKIIEAWQRASAGLKLDSTITESEVPIRREKNKDETIDANHGSFDNNLDVVNRAIRRIRGRVLEPVTDLHGF
jgi:hypothetical protein